MPKNKLTLGIDVGGTFIKYGLVNNQNKLSNFGQIATPKTRVMIVNLLIKLIKDHRLLINKVGVGLPGRIDIRRGEVINVANLPLSKTPIVKLIQRQLKLPIIIDNDARCFALAEALVGSGKKYRTVIGIILGSGVGGGIVLNKKLFHGRGNAGEIGHHFIDFKNNKDVEDYLGASRINFNPGDYQNLEKQAKLKNKKALNFWQNIGLTLGYTCLNLIHIFDPDIIILGGKLTKNFKLFYPETIKIINKHCLVKPPKIIKSKLIDKAGVIGAALLFKTSNF